MNGIFSTKIFHHILIKAITLLLFLYVIAISSYAQQQYELNKGWKCKKAILIKDSGTAISNTSYLLTDWMPAVVPGTVLTSLLANKLIPDPFYGMNNKLIPDIYKVGRNEYTYWFANDFTDSFPEQNEQIWLQLRGINYSCHVFLNGHQLTDEPDKGMFLRQYYDITPYMSKDYYNRLAVIVYPPDPVGNPNGGQGGDGMIAHSITNQYVAGWDWIQPIADRNTGIWDKVFIKKTKQVIVENTHITTIVPGKRYPDEHQAPAKVRVTTEVENANDTGIATGTVQYEVEGKKVSIGVTLEPHTMQLVEFPELMIDSPRLWWPNGYGEQPLYELKVKFLVNRKTVSDEERVSFGIREIKTVWNKKTNSREIRVNGQKIFMKGGNRILSDELLRFSNERYDAEVRYHRDMNLNLIRVWGGGITERPEFYDACDRYGLLVMQDFWVSGDCNGRWYDAMKLEDTNARRQYPDDHRLFIRSLEDEVKMLRNHPSLALWCGGNEIRPPKDVLEALRDTLLPELDGTRYFFEYSNDDSMSLHGGDGPYTIQTNRYFWEHRSFPFNSEIGSVGIGDEESLERFVPKQDMTPPYYDTALHQWTIDTVWQYHKYIGYDSAIEVYGHPKDIADFTKKAQLVNYDQYRALMEGASGHIWDWYTGIIMWKTQNPWTAMLGQMYDVYLDPNACLYGTKEGSQPLHIMYDPVHKSVMAVNNGFKTTGKLQLLARSYDIQGRYKVLDTSVFTVPPCKAMTVHHFNGSLDTLCRDEGSFLSLGLYDPATQRLIDDNLYWLPDANKRYSGLAKMPKAKMNIRYIKSSYTKNGTCITEMTLYDFPDSPIAFFIRLSIIDPVTHKRILPVFYSDNYISLLPGQQKTIKIEYPSSEIHPNICIEGWNVEKQFIY